MEFHILGPLEVIANGRALDLGGQKQRALLAILLLEPNRVVSAAGLIDALVREHPLREGLRGQLMLALYRSGRQAEALETCQSGRRLLIEELGLEPGEALKKLERAILAHDPSLDLPESVSPKNGDVLSASPPTQQPSIRKARKTVSVLFVDVAPESDDLDPEVL